MPNVYADQLANEAANEYAKFLLENKEPNEEALKKILAHKMIVGEPTVLIGNAYLEEDLDPQGRKMIDDYMDAHGLLLEL